MAVEARGQVEAGRREQLLKAARKVFAEKGYGKATVSDVVREAGVAQGTFYLYFPSKKAILVTLAREFRAALLGAIFAPELAALPARERGRAMVRAAFRVSRDNPDLVRALHLGLELEDLEDPDLQGSDVVERVAAFLRDKVRPPGFRGMDPEIAARLVCCLVEDAALECFVCEDGSRAQHYEDTLVEMIDRILWHEP